MAIRIQHADVADYARLGTLAGQAKAATAAVERQAATDRQVMQIQAQRASQERAQAHQKEMAEFDAFLDTQKYQASQAWEVEKMELRSRHDFEMVEAKREADFQYQIQREQQKKQEQEAKLKAIDEQEGWSDTEKHAARFKIITGASIPRTTGVSPLEELLGQQDRTGTPIIPPIKSEITQTRETETGVLSNFLRTAIPKLDTESQNQLKDIIARGNPTEIKRAYDRLRKTVAPETLRAETDEIEKFRRFEQRFAFGG